MDAQRREFAIISEFFQKRAGQSTGSSMSENQKTPFRRQRNDVLIGIGDDAAVVTPPADSRIAITTDTMVNGVHFDEATSPHALGYKLVAVNLSDLAAMGAEPAWVSLACSLPNVDEAWLQAFSEGLFSALDYYHCELIGGDMTRGPLTLTMTAQGILPLDRCLQRSGAQPGDRIFVSGNLGDAALALAGLQSEIELRDATIDELQKRLFYPTPRVALGQLLRNQATSAIDLSDGLAGDLQHILAASGVGARVNLDALPASLAFRANLKLQEGWHYQLNGGDDYELCFTVPENRCGVLESLVRQAGVTVSCIGTIEAQRGLRFFHKDKVIKLDDSSYSHF